MDNPNSLAGLYSKMEADRDPYLQRGYDCAALTIPHVLVENAQTGEDLPTPYQGIGARGVRSLSAKMMLALFPPSSTSNFFRLTIGDFDLETLGEDVVAEVEESLGAIERQVQGTIESEAMRPQLHSALRQLVVAGNVLLHLEETGGAKVHKMNTYMVKRSNDGAVQMIILKETITPAMLPEEQFKDTLQEKTERNELDDTVEIYTGIKLVDNKYEVWQEALEQTIETTKGSYKKDELPWIALRMEPITGESWGYGLCAELYGDLSSCEGLAMATLEASAAASKVLFMVDPTGKTKQSDCTDSPNGAFISGNAEDVTTLQVEKAADMRVALEAFNELKRELSAAFLLTQSIQRPGERVTATEIQTLAQDLEATLSGQYSLLSAELQLPLVRLILSKLTKQKRIPKMPQGVIKPTIVAGLDALGRGADLMRLQAFVQDVAQTFGPQVLQEYVNVSDYMKRKATALGLNTDGLVRSDEEVQAQRQQQMAQQTLMGMAPQGLQMAADAAQQPEQG